jgi:RNA recognition motif-containing protein
VGGLDQSVTDAEFRTHFESFGTVTDSIVMIDKRTNRSRGFGFVTFGDAAAFEQVLKSAHIIKGKTVEVKAASPRERSAAAGNWHGGGGGYGGGYPQSSQSYSSSYGNGWGGGRGGYGGERVMTG